MIISLFLLGFFVYFAFDRLCVVLDALIYREPAPIKAYSVLIGSSTCAYLVLLYLIEHEFCVGG